MSYILEALKKSEQERRIGAVPDLSVAQETVVRATPRWPRWLLGALLLNASILLFVAWRIWDGRQPAVPPEPAAVAPAAKAQPPVEDTNKIVAVPPAVPAPETEPARLPEPVSGPVAAAAVEKPAAVAQSMPDAQTVGPDLEPMPELDAAAGAAAVVRWEDLPADERAGLPVPRIDVHVFASEPERRFVLIDLRKYLQGDSLDSGAVVEAILADGIVLSYQGRQYRVDRP